MGRPTARGKGTHGWRSGVCNSTSEANFFLEPESSEALFTTLSA
jgi:hypothetical protein